MFEALKSKPRGGIPLPSLTSWWRIWQDQLVRCLPAPLREQVRKPQTRLWLEPQEGRLWGRLSRQGSEQVLGDWVPQDVDALQQMVQLAQREAAEIFLLAPRGSLLVRRFSLPAQVKENLRRAIEFELDRVTPFAAEELYYDFRVRPSASREQISIELAFLKRAHLDQWLGILGELGGYPQVVTWEGGWPEANLLPPGARSQPRRTGLWLNRLLWVLILTLVLAVLGTPLWQKRAIAIDLLQRLGEARHQADTVVKTRKQLEDGLKSASFVLERKQAAPHMTELLRKLTELLPDHSWISQLDYGDEEVQIRGESPQATALIGLLAKEPSFQGIGFRSPVTGVPNTSIERFHIGFKYVNPRGKP